MGPPYGKRDPYYSHTTPIFESLKIWEWYGKLPIRGSHYWGFLESPFNIEYLYELNFSKGKRIAWNTLKFSRPRSLDKKMPFRHCFILLRFPWLFCLWTPFEAKMRTFASSEVAKCRQSVLEDSGFEDVDNFL